jgi:GTP cyclohydrolase II
LYLPASVDLVDKDIVIIDNVCTTGETLRAVYKLLCMAGADSSRIVEGIVLFTEGQKTEQIQIAENLYLKLHAFSHIPVLQSDPSLNNVFFRLYSSCDLPIHYGKTKFCIFKHRALDLEAIVCVSPLTFISNKKTNIPVRIHDACITSETFHSIKCDCQL